MAATELRVTLELESETWCVTLRAESGCSGYLSPRKLALPFTVDDIPLFERALDLSGRTGLQRRFEPGQVTRLRELGLLRGEVAASPDGATLTGTDLRGESLRERLSEWLSQILLEPLRHTIDEHFAEQRGARPGERPLLYLCLKMRVRQDQPLLRLPWELLHRRRLRKGDIHIGRHLLYENRVSDLRAPADRLALLLLLSEPSGLPGLRLKKERKRIKKGLKASACGASIQVETLKRAGYREFGQRLLARQDRPTIVHFAGHGDFGWRCEQCRRVSSSPTANPCGDPGCGFLRVGEPRGFLAFTNPKDGQADWVDARDLHSLLTQPGLDIRLLVLNACKTATGRGGEDVFNGIAQQLMDVVPAVVATPYPLGNDAAREFAGLLYRGIGAGLPLFEALHHAQQLIAHAHEGEWYRTVLYLRARSDDGGRLLTLRRSETTPAEPPRTPTGLDPVALQDLARLLDGCDDDAIADSFDSIRQLRGLSAIDGYWKPVGRYRDIGLSEAIAALDQAVYLDPAGNATANRIPIPLADFVWRVAQQADKRAELQAWVDAMLRGLHPSLAAEKTFAAFKDSLALGRMAAAAPAPARSHLAIRVVEHDANAHGQYAIEARLVDRDGKGDSIDLIDADGIDAMPVLLRKALGSRAVFEAIKALESRFTIEFFLPTRLLTVDLDGWALRHSSVSEPFTVRYIATVRAGVRLGPTANDEIFAGDDPGAYVGGWERQWRDCAGWRDTQRDAKQKPESITRVDRPDHNYRDAPHHDQTCLFLLGFDPGRDGGRIDPILRTGAAALIWRSRDVDADYRRELFEQVASAYPKEGKRPCFGDLPHALLLLRQQAWQDSRCTHPQDPEKWHTGGYHLLWDDPSRTPEFGGRGDAPPPQYLSDPFG